MASFGARIREARRAVPLTQKGLIERLADAGYTVSQPLISLIENDRRKPPYHGVMALATVLEANAYDLLQLAGYPPPLRVTRRSTTDVFFRGRDDPEPSTFDQRIFEIEQRPGDRYVLYPVESYVTRPSSQIARQESLGRCSSAFWRRRRAIFEQHLTNGGVAYHLHSIPDLLQIDADRGVPSHLEVVDLLRALQTDLRTYPTFHLGLAPAGLNLSFVLRMSDRDPIGVVAAYPRNWGYRPATYLEGLCLEDETVVYALFDEFLAIWRDPATITRREEVDLWIEDQCLRLLDPDSHAGNTKMVG
jgi:transcriptional regulator with XRE-family HTH domain